MDGFNLYHWDKVETIENYGPGDVIVMARSLDEAVSLAATWARDDDDLYMNRYTDANDDVERARDMVSGDLVRELRRAEPRVYAAATCVAVEGSQ